MVKATGINLDRNDFPDEKSYKKEYDRQYSQLRKARRRELYQKNKDHERKQQAEYRKNNPELFKEINRKRNEKYYSDKEEQRKAVERGWKSAGIKFFDDTFDKWFSTTNCESCNIELIQGKGKGKNKRVLDHDHFSGYPRNTICHSCNVWRRGFDNRRIMLHLELYRYFHRI